MDPDYLARLVYDSSAGRVGYWKNPLITLNPFGGDVFSETIGNLLGDKNNLTLFTTLGASEGEFPVFNIRGVNCKTSLILIPPLAMSSRISRFLGLMVRKMASSTTSFSKMFQRVSPGAR